MKTPDMIWTQDTKILQQVIKAAVGDGKNPVVNQINIGQITYPAQSDGSGEKDSFLAFIDSLKKPRLQDAIDRIITHALFTHDEQKDAAAWLGISPRAICYQKQRLLKEGVI